MSAANSLLGPAGTEDDKPFDEMFEPCSRASHIRGAQLVSQSRSYYSKAPQSVPASQTASARKQQESFVGPTEFGGSHDHLWRSVPEAAADAATAVAAEEGHLSHVRKGYLFATGGSASGPSSTLSFLQKKGHSAGGQL